MVSTSPTRQSAFKEWSREITVALASALFTLTATYATQFLAFLRDAPSRSEVEATIEKHSRQANTSIGQALSDIKSSLAELKSEARESNRTLADVATRVTRLEASERRSVQ